MCIHPRWALGVNLALHATSSGAIVDISATNTSLHRGCALCRCIRVLLSSQLHVFSCDVSHQGSSSVDAKAAHR